LWNLWFHVNVNVSSVSALPPLSRHTEQQSARLPLPRCDAGNAARARIAEGVSAALGFSSSAARLCASETTYSAIPPSQIGFPVASSSVRTAIAAVLERLIQSSAVAASMMMGSERSPEWLLLLFRVAGIFAGG
jgi:hypothetical protein